jgi:hypothetical protein
MVKDEKRGKQKATRTPKILVRPGDLPRYADLPTLITMSLAGDFWKAFGEHLSVWGASKTQGGRATGG